MSEKMPIFRVDYNLIENNLKDLVNCSYDRLITECKTQTNCCLKYANKEFVKQLISRSQSDESLDSIEIIDGKSDLIANQYEGGFKLWEGLQDIIDYFIEFDVFANYSGLQSLNILELGCGSGLVSIYCSKRLPNAKIFVQDFNEDVIKYFTSINVFLNNEDSKSKLNSRFNYLFGDWSSTLDDINGLGLKFDLIITSETLYNSDNYQKLVDIFKSSLTTNGSVYIASKSHYFGVGGGTYSFVDFIENDSQLSSEICHEIDAPLVRHIIKLTQKQINS